MAVRIIEGDAGAVLYCSTAMWAFGPIFDDSETAEDFLEWLHVDARTLTNRQLETKHDEWHGETYVGGVFSPERRDHAEPTDNEIYNRVGVEGGIGYDMAADVPGSLGENDWRL